MNEDFFIVKRLWPPFPKPDPCPDHQFQIINQNAGLTLILHEARISFTTSESSYRDLRIVSVALSSKDGSWVICIMSVRSVQSQFPWPQWSL